MPGQGPGTFIKEGESYFKLTNGKNPIGDKRFYEWIPVTPNTAPKSRWAKVWEAIFGPFDPPGF